MLRNTDTTHSWIFSGYPLARCFGLSWRPEVPLWNGIPGKVTPFWTIPFVSCPGTTRPRGTHGPYICHSCTSTMEGGGDWMDHTSQGCPFIAPEPVVLEGTARYGHCFWPLPSDLLPQTLHGTAIYAYIDPPNHPNVGIYGSPMECLGSGPPSRRSCTVSALRRFCTCLVIDKTSGGWSFCSMTEVASEGLAMASSNQGEK